MSEYVKLLILLAPPAVLAVAAILMLRRYKSKGDCCPHGVRGGEGFDCRQCEGGDAAADGLTY